MGCPFNKTKFSYLCLLAILIVAAPAFGKGLLSTYNVGAYYAFTSSYTNLDYDAQASEKLPRDCAINTEVAGKMRCRTYLVPNNSEGFGIFLQKPFVRQGFFYLEPGFTFSTLSYSGTVGNKPNQVISSTQVDNGIAKSADSEEQPLTKVLMELYGINWQGYFKFGVTPRVLPDVFLSLGLGLQTVGGRVKVLTTDRTRWVLQPSAYAEFEMVIVRLSTAYLSAFYGQDQTVLGRYGSNLIEDYPDGADLANFKATLINAGAGIRLLMPF